MAITDEEYASAIEQHMQAHKAYLEKRKEEVKMGVIDSIGNILGGVSTQPVTVTSPQAGSILVSTTGTQPTWASNVSMTQSGTKILSEQDLKNDAMVAPLSALIDMWTMRWQGEWVSESEFQEDDFWRIALIRLVGANKLEKHHLASQYAPEIGRAHV